LKEGERREWDSAAAVSARDWRVERMAGRDSGVGSKSKRMVVTSYGRRRTTRDISC
jgi:hypothetical protein